MKTKIESSTWLYAIVINKNNNEQLLGQTDSKNSISFIPVFRDKTTAQKGLNFLSKKANDKHEVQAIIYEDLIKYASDEKLLIFIIDEKGNIEKRIIP